MCSFLLMVDLQLILWKAPKLRCPSTSATRLDSNRHTCVPVSWRGRCSNVVLLPKESAFQSSTNHFYLLTQTLHMLFIALPSLCMHCGLVLRCCRWVFCCRPSNSSSSASWARQWSLAQVMECPGYVVVSWESLFGSSSGSQRRNFLYLLGNFFLRSPAEVCPARRVSRQLPRAVYLVGMLRGSCLGSCLKMQKQ